MRLKFKSRRSSSVDFRFQLSSMVRMSKYLTSSNGVCRINSIAIVFTQISKDFSFGVWKIKKN